MTIERNWWPPQWWAPDWWDTGWWPELEDIEVIEGVREAILDWAEIAFGAGNVIWNDRSFPRLPFPYATLHWFGETEIGLPERIQADDIVALTVREAVQETRRLTIQVEVLTGAANDLNTQEAMEVMESGLLTLQTALVIRLFREAGISFLEHERPIRLDEFDGEHWERRALCDVHFLHVISSELEAIGRIDTAIPALNILE